MNTSKPSSYKVLRLIVCNSHFTPAQPAKTLNLSTGSFPAGLKNSTGSVSISSMLRIGLDRPSTVHHATTASQSGNWLLGGAQLGIRRAVASTNTFTGTLATELAALNAAKQSLLKPLIESKQVKKSASKANVIYLFTGSNTQYESHV